MEIFAGLGIERLRADQTVSGRRRLADRIRKNQKGV
jgi:hypothetical protein